MLNFSSLCKMIDEDGNQTSDAAQHRVVCLVHDVDHVEPLVHVDLFYGLQVVLDVEAPFEKDSTT
jgi:hypothetical protein